MSSAKGASPQIRHKEDLLHRTVASTHQSRPASQFLEPCYVLSKIREGFAKITTPLRRLTEKNVKFRWNGDCDSAFLEIKRGLTSAPIMAYPQFDKEFILDTDASGSAIGAVLSQRHEDGEHVIAYGSRSLTRAEKKY